MNEHARAPFWRCLRKSAGKSACATAARPSATR